MAWDTASYRLIPEYSGTLASGLAHKAESVDPFEEQ